MGTYFVIFLLLFLYKMSAFAIAGFVASALIATVTLIMTINYSCYEKSDEMRKRCIGWFSRSVISFFICGFLFSVSPSKAEAYTTIGIIVATEGYKNFENSEIGKAAIDYLHYAMQEKAGERVEK